ncbi:MAG: PepSY domain-containing protein [Bacteroidetes bacterium]|nr:PepSY domain-containing protein [Bacteroidota bacterium]
MTVPRKLKKIVGFLHLWLGLITGLVVLIVSLTGAIYCFAPEIQSATQPYRHVVPRQQPFLPPSQLRAIAEKQLPGKPAQYIYYSRPDKAASVLFYGAGGYYYTVFIDPYDGKVLHVKNMRKDFFTIILYLHISLLIPYGGDIVHWCTLIFLFMIISGIILWWPRNKAARKQRFAVKWGASPKRLNYDLHNILGFYASWIAIFIVFTGLMWSFEWFSKGVYNLTGAKHSIIKEAAALSDTSAFKTTAVPAPAIDRVWQDWLREKGSRYVAAGIQLPQTKSAAIVLRDTPDEDTYYKADARYYDQYTGAAIPGSWGAWGYYKDATTVADKIRRMSYDIHVGAIAGWPGRIAVFLAALVAASLPITGFMIWRNRRKKRKKKDTAAPLPGKEGKLSRDMLAGAVALQPNQ